MMSSLLLCLVFLLSSLAQAQVNESETNDSTVTYPAQFFDQYSPVSVSDMLDRIPGIESVLAVDDFAESFSGGDRGLGGTSQILIDGKRLAGKNNEAKSQLSRIAASDVESIQIVRGTSSDLDVQNSGQLVNIVLKQAQSRSSISAEVGMRHYQDSTLEPEGIISLTGQQGRFNYLVSASTRPNYQVEENFELSLLPGLDFNETVELDRVTDSTNYNISTNLSFDFSPRDRFALNALYAENNPAGSPFSVNDPLTSSVFRRITDFSGLAESVSYERERSPASASNWEIGGDYEHTFSDNSKFKFLFIVNDKENEVVRERFGFVNIGDEENKNLFLNNSGRYQEKIIRTSYTFSLAENQGLELGVETARTTQNSALALGLPLGGTQSPLHGGLTAVSVPNAISTVEEDRYEGFAVHNWRINSRMSLESSLISEYSEITQTGDISNSRDFDFLKPKFDFRFDVSSSFQLRLSAEKNVAQLRFSDFSAATNNQDEDQDTIAGNPELVQEESWRYNMNLDYRLPNDGGVLSSRLFFYDIDENIGRTDISPLPSDLSTTNGNVGSGTVLGLNLNASIRFGFLGMPSALMTAGLLVQESLIDDPLIARERKVVPYDRGSFNFGFRHDVSSRGLNYGFNYRDGIDGNRPLWDINNVLFIGSRSNLTVFVEKSGFAGLTYRLEVINLMDHDNKQERRRYNGYLRDGVLSEIERFSNLTGVKYTFKVRGTF
jgi:outer membrane receptor for ferrienterochelin and colicin